MNFKEWLLLSESIEVNFDTFIEDIKNYAQPNELELKTIQVNDKQKQLIIDALKKANQEKQEYLKYLLGFLKNKPNALPEDLDRSLDAIKWAITTNKLNKRQIATDGWYNTGKNSNELIKQRDAEASQPSKRQEKRELKSGQAQDLTPIIVSEPYKIYFIPKIKDDRIKTEDELNDFVKTQPSKDRHKLLCKYGKDTGWCTASPTGTYHGAYAHRDIYIVHENDKPLYQFSGCIHGVDKKDDDDCQFMDTNDHPATQIPLELADLIMEKLPEIGRFYKAVNYTSNINKIEYLQDILNIFDIQNINQLGNNDLRELFYYSTNRDKIIKIIAEYKKELSDTNVFNCLMYSENKEEIAKILGQDNINRLRHNSIRLLMYLLQNKEQIARILGQNNIKKLTPDDITNLVSRPDGHEIAKILLQYQIEFISWNVFYLLLYSKNTEEAAEILGSENINKLDTTRIKELLDRKTNRLIQHDKIAIAIAKYKTNLTVEEIMILIKNSENKENVAQSLGSENISKLNGADVKQLLMYQNKNEIKSLSQAINKYHNDQRVKNILKPFVNA